MKIYLAAVRILNWLIVVTLSIVGMLWFAGSVSIPPHFAPGDSKEAAVQPEEPPAAEPTIAPAADTPQQQAPPPAADQPAAQPVPVLQEAQEPEEPVAESGKEAAEHPKPTLENAKRTAFITALVMIGLNIGSVVVKLRGSTRVRYLIFEKEGAGSLKIAVDAIEDTLMKCAAQIPEIQYSDIRMVLEKGGKMPRRAITHCIFTDVPNLFVVQDNVRQILTSRYQEIFPNETLVFDIVVDRLKAEHEPPDRRKKVEEETRFRGEEFFGPKYPVQR